MRRVIEMRRADGLEAGEYVMTPQHGTGVLLAHAIAGVEPIDEGKRIEITTADGRKHVVNADDRVVVAF